jgi:hypothetical protein
VPTSAITPSFRSCLRHACVCVRLFCTRVVMLQRAWLALMSAR